MLANFFSPAPSLKICGVTTRDDTLKLAELGVAALGLNFWPQSKRYCPPKSARIISPPVSGRILRVGVFVNNARDLAEELVADDIIDIVQLHGDESFDDIQYFLEKQIPVIRAVSALSLPDTDLPTENFALLIDTPAGKNYGGTGKTFDWSIARDFAQSHPKTPMILAGGISPGNAEEALIAACPAALDVASGAEISPGIKDFQKVNALQSIISK